MDTEVALCQVRPVTGDPEANAGIIEGIVRGGKANVYIFPEMFVTGYGADYASLEEGVSLAVGRLRDLSRETGDAVIVGSPRYSDAGLFNSLLFLSPDGDACYDKTHLARFGVYSEDGFVAGDRPVVGSHRGTRFGLSVCYDVFFPELYVHYSSDRVDVNVCALASAVPSKPFMDTVVPARALESVAYFAYVNNTGPMAGLEMHGCSRAVGPLGRTIVECGKDERVETFTVDRSELEEARSVRRHLDDMRPEDLGFIKRY